MLHLAVSRSLPRSRCRVRARSQPSPERGLPPRAGAGWEHRAGFQHASRPCWGVPWDPRATRRRGHSGHRGSEAARDQGPPLPSAVAGSAADFGARESRGRHEKSGMSHPQTLRFPPPLCRGLHLGQAAGSMGRSHVHRGFDLLAAF